MPLRQQPLTSVTNQPTFNYQLLLQILRNQSLQHSQPEGFNLLTPPEWREQSNRPAAPSYGEGCGCGRMAGGNDNHLNSAQPDATSPPKRKLRFSKNTGAAGSRCWLSPRSADCATPVTSE